MFGKLTPFKRLAEKSLANEQISQYGLLIVTTTLDGFSWANHRRFANFLPANLPTIQYTIQLALDFHGLSNFHAIFLDHENVLTKC